MKKIRSIIELSMQLAKSNFKLRNEGSFLGIFWYLLEPLIFFVILLFLGGVINKNPIPSYPLYLLLGILMFNFFVTVTTQATSTLDKNHGFIKSLRINSESFVIATIIQFTFSHIIEMILFTIIMFFIGSHVYFILLYPILFFFFCLFTIGLSFTLATISVYFVDLQNIWSVFTILLWFVTPIFYSFQDPSSIIFKLNYINPLTHFMTVTRDVIIYHRVPTLLATLGICIFSIIVFFIGLYIFEKNKKSFAEIL
jgi:lipopolysaccharide transport system permease protein